MNREIPFVLGFAFHENLTSFIVIKKNRGPSFNVGKWNAPGGKIECGESARGAISREFFEEVGIATTPEEWSTFHVEKHLARAEQTQDPRLYSLTVVLDHERFFSYKTMTDEEVDIAGVKELRSDDTRMVYNMTYLVNMAVCWHLNKEHRWIEG